MTKITFTISKKIKQDIEKTAKNLNLSVNEYIATLCKLGLKLEKNQKIKS